MSGSDVDSGENVRVEDSQEEFSDTGSPQHEIASLQVQNQPHDEEVAISDDDDSDAGNRIIDPENSDEDDEDDRGIAGMSGGMGDPPRDDMGSPPRGGLSDEEDARGRYDGGTASLTSQQGASSTLANAMGFPNQDAEDMVGGGGVGDGYNAREFEHLNVSSEVKELFQYIGRYQPLPHKLDVRLKCFIPDYIPAVGDIDEFIKVPRPDGKPDFLGLRMLDEPATVQSDSAVLNQQIRNVSKTSGSKFVEVGAIENASKNPKRIDNWIEKMAKLHSDKPPPTVSYSKNMPEIEALMEEWPPEMEDLLNQVRLPSGNLDIDIPTLTKVVCNLLDIPVYEGKGIESLHVLFTLFVEFKNNPFLKAQQQAAMGMSGGGSMMGGMMGGTMGSDAMGDFGGSTM